MDQLQDQSLTQAELNPMQLVDWRDQFLSDSRQRIVSKIMDTLKRHLPFSGQEGLLELKKIAVRFEEKTYASAISQPDYLRKISMKMLSMETKSQNNINNSMATNTVGNGKNPTETGSQCIQSQVHNQGQPISIPGLNSQSQSRQQLLAQSLQNSITSTAMQCSVGLSSALPSVCTQSNLVGQNSGFGDFFPTQNISGISQNSLGNSAQGLPSSMFSSVQRQMQGRQLMQQQIAPQQQSQSQNSQQFLYQQQLQHQLMRQKMQQGSIPHTLMQSHLQQQQNLLQSNSQSLMQPSSVMQSTLQNQSSSVQHSAQSVIQQHQQSVVRQNQVQQSPIVHQQQISVSQSQQQQMNGQQLVGQQTNVSNMPQNQLSGQQNISEMQLQRSTGQQNNVSSMQQHQQALNSQNNFSNHSQMSSQSSISGLQQQQQLGGVQPLNSIQSNTHSGHGLPQSKAQQQTQSNTSLMSQGQQSQVQQQLISQMQVPLQQQLSLQQQPNLIQRDMQQRLTSGNLLQPQSITEQQKQLLQSQRILQDTSTSLDSTVQSGQVVGGEWQEELYQKIKAMKDMYLTDLLEMYQKTSSKLYQPKPPQLERYKVFRSMLEHVLLFLQLPKHNITLAHKEKIASYEKQILGFINTNKRKPIPYTNPMNLQPSDSQILSSQHPPPTTSMNTLPLQSTSLPLQDQMLQPQQQLKQQLQHRQMHQHLMHKQFLQQQQQRKQTQPMLLNQQQMPHFHQITDMNDLKPRQQQQQLGMGIKPGIFQQQQQQQQMGGGQRSSVFHQQQSLKPGSSFPGQILQVPSPAHHLSPQVDQQSLSFSKTGTPLQVGDTGSPFVVPSPSTPLAPSPMPGDSEKPQSGISSAVSNPGSAPNHPSAPSLAIGTPGISASPLLAEFTGQETNHHGNTSVAAKPVLTEQPLDRIIKVIKSMSTKALSRSVSDMSSVISMVDGIAGSAPGNGSRAAIGDDLVAMTRCRVQARASSASHDSNVALKKMRRHMSSMPLSSHPYPENGNDILMRPRRPDSADFESTATSTSRNPKMEALMEEVEGINNSVIDTVLDICEEDGDGEGIVVKCSFTATALSPSLKEHYTSGKMSSIKPIFFLVPLNYPNVSPLLLEKASDTADETIVGREDVSAKVISRFNVSLRSIPQPMSLGKMAKAWDMCVRSAILEYVKLHGGGTFTSKYGDWENNDMS